MLKFLIILPTAFYSGLISYKFTNDKVFKYFVYDKVFIPYTSFTERKHKKILEGQTNLYTNKDFIDTLCVVSKGIGELLIFPIYFEKFKQDLINDTRKNTMISHHQIVSACVIVLKKI